MGPAPSLSPPAFPSPPYTSRAEPTWIRGRLNRVSGGDEWDAGRGVRTQRMLTDTENTPLPAGARRAQGYFEGSGPVSAEAAARAGADLPLGRVGTPEEIAKAVLSPAVTRDRARARAGSAQNFARRRSERCWSTCAIHRSGPSPHRELSQVVRRAFPLPAGALPCRGRFVLCDRAPPPRRRRQHGALSHPAAACRGVVAGSHEKICEYCHP